MSSPIDYIFMNSRDKGVVIINILSSSRISIEFMMRNTILALDDWCYQRQHYCIPSNTKLVPVLCCTLSSLLSNLCYILPRSITIFDVKNVVRIAPPLKNSCYNDTSHHHHSFLVLVLIPTWVPTSGLWCVNSKLLATLLLWSYWSIVSLYVYGLMNHHSNIDRAT